MFFSLGLPESEFQSGRSAVGWGRRLSAYHPVCKTVLVFWQYKVGYFYKKASVWFWLLPKDQSASRTWRSPFLKVPHINSSTWTLKPPVALCCLHFHCPRKMCGSTPGVCLAGQIFSTATCEPLEVPLLTVGTWTRNIFKSKRSLRGK